MNDQPGSEPESPAPRTPQPAPVRPVFQERHERPTSPTLVLAARPRSKALAIASLLLAVLGFLCAPLGVLALLLGVFALGKISRGTAAGRGPAIAGAVLGPLGLIVSIPLACAVVVPNLVAPRGHPNETGAVQMLCVYSGAQSIYRRGSWDEAGPTYATRLPDLHFQVDATGKQLNLIDASFAAASGVSGQPRQGYLFENMETIDGEPINWTEDFAICALPVDYGRGGRKTLVMRSNGAIWAKDQGPEGGFVTDFPSDPGREGWERVQ